MYVFMNEIPMVGEPHIEGERVVPYHRCYRPMKKGMNADWTARIYIQDPGYATTPDIYVRAFLNIQQDILKLFRYIEPAAANLYTYSYNIQQMLIRTCVEIEANFKAILKDNKFTSKAEYNWNIIDYSRVNVTHNLNRYKVEYPVWDEPDYVFCPFAEWGGNKHGAPRWYKAYNNIKHRKDALKEFATLGNLLEAFAGLFVLLTAQFNKTDFDPGFVNWSDPKGNIFYENKMFGIGNYLIVHYPEWREDEKYNCDWHLEYNKEDRFRVFDYDQLRKVGDRWDKKNSESYFEK